MPNPQVSTRIPPDTLDRLDRLVEAYNAANPANPLDRGGILRALAVRALPLMEAELQPKRRPAKARAK